MFRRHRGNRWEFVIRRKGLLPRPVYLSFNTEEEGVAYCQRIEALLDRGVVPDDLEQKSHIHTIENAFSAYQDTVNISKADAACKWRRNWEPDGGVKGSQSVRKTSSGEPDGYCRGFALPWAVGVA
jgi:hypothetical protein